MFSFDEELFTTASAKISSSIDGLEGLKGIVDAINSFSLDCDFKDNLNTIISSIDTIMSIITELNVDVKRTKYLYELSNEQFLLYKSLFGRLYPHEDSKDIFKMILEMSTSPFSYLPGQYGGDQSNPIKLYEQYILNKDQMSESERKKAEIIIELFNKKGIVNENEIDYLLIYTRNSSCGFVVVANILCDLYKNKPEEFEKIYGYPLYYKTDSEFRYNYEAIIVDTFLSSNDSKLNSVVTDESSFNKLIVTLGGVAYDTSVRVDNMLTLVRNYFPDITGVTAKRDISVNTYREYMENSNYDYACIAVRRFTLKPYGNNQSTENYYCDGGHWMSITGLSSDNHFIVSSWGKEWELVNGTPYIKNKEWIFIQPEHENDGGLVFFKVGDINGE